MKNSNKKKVLEFLTDFLVCVCLGIIIDYFAHTTWIFTLVGAVLGIVVAIVLNNVRKKKESNQHK